MYTPSISTTSTKAHSLDNNTSPPPSSKKKELKVKKAKPEAGWYL